MGSAKPATSKVNLASLPVASSTGFSRRRKTEPAPYAPRPPLKYANPWRNVVVFFINRSPNKTLTLSQIYSRMGWVKGQAYNRRRNWHLLTFREVLMLAQACEAPTGPFLRMLAREWPTQTLHRDCSRKYARRGMLARRRCRACGSSHHETQRCPKVVTPAEAVQALKVPRRERSRE